MTNYHLPKHLFLILLALLCMSACSTTTENGTDTEKNANNNGNQGSGSGGQTAIYTVEYYQEDLNGNYVLYTTERLSGTIGSQTSVREKTFEGFKVLPFSQGVITADGNTVVKISYTRKDITITLDLNGGYFESDNIPLTFSGKYGADANIPTPVRNDNYTFDCWNCNGKNYANLSTFPAVSGTYTARWTEQKEPPKEIIITFDPNGADEATPQAIETTSGKSIELPELGDNFSHWNTKADGTGESYKGAAVFTESVTLYAILLAEKKITITFDTNGGSGTMEPMKVLSGQWYKLPKCTFTPPKENYGLKEWNTKADGTGKSYWADTYISESFSADTTLYAIWAKIEIGFDVKQPDNNEYAHISQEQTENTVIFKCNQYNSDYDSYTWYIDGEKRNEISDTFTVDTSKMKAGLYTVMVKIKYYNGKYYSDTTTFYVKKQAGGK